MACAQEPEDIAMQNLELTPQKDENRPLVPPIVVTPTDTTSGESIPISMENFPISAPNVVAPSNVGSSRVGSMLGSSMVDLDRISPASILRDRSRESGRSLMQASPSDDENDPSEEEDIPWCRRNWRRYVKRISCAVFIITAIISIVLLVYYFQTKDSKPKAQPVQTKNKNDRYPYGPPPMVYKTMRTNKNKTTGLVTSPTNDTGSVMKNEGFNESSASTMSNGYELSVENSLFSENGSTTEAAVAENFETAVLYVMKGTQNITSENEWWNNDGSTASASPFTAPDENIPKSRALNLNLLNESSTTSDRSSATLSENDISFNLDLPVFDRTSDAVEEKSITSNRNLTDAKFADTRTNRENATYLDDSKNSSIVYLITVTDNFSLNGNSITSSLFGVSATDTYGENPSFSNHNLDKTSLVIESATKSYVNFTSYKDSAIKVGNQTQTSTSDDNVTRQLGNTTTVVFTEAIFTNNSTVDQPTTESTNATVAADGMNANPIAMSDNAKKPFTSWRSPIVHPNVFTNTDVHSASTDVKLNESQVSGRIV